MNEDNGVNFVSLIDEAGNTVDLEIVETFDYKDRTFTAFLPMDVPTDSPDYGLVFLENLYEDDEVVFDTINDMDERVLIGRLLMAGRQRQGRKGQQEQLLHSVCTGVP